MTPWSMIANGTCRGTGRRMSARLDGDLDARAQGRFDRHIAGCRRCAQVLESLRRTLDLLHDVGAAPHAAAAAPTASVAPDVLRRIGAGRRNDTDGAR